jgi:hypothetical protein
MINKLMGVSFHYDIHYFFNYLLEIDLYSVRN